MAKEAGVADNLVLLGEDFEFEPKNIYEDFFSPSGLLN
jgi:hypothetical protein